MNTKQSQNNHPLPIYILCTFIFDYRGFCSLQRSKTPAPSVCLAYDTKPSYGEVPVLELWGMWNTLSLQLLPGPLWLWEVEPVRIPSMGQSVKYNNLILHTTLKHLTVYKQNNNIK